MSKVAERVVAQVLVSFLESTNVFGSSLWAFRPRRSCRDLVTLLVCTWSFALNSGQKVGVYFSDISAAFDRVDANILLAKCKRAGVGELSA